MYVCGGEGGRVREKEHNWPSRGLRCPSDMMTITTTDTFKDTYKQKEASERGIQSTATIRRLRLSAFTFFPHLRHPLCVVAHTLSSCPFALPHTHSSLLLMSAKESSAPAALRCISHRKKGR